MKVLQCNCITGALVMRYLVAGTEYKPESYMMVIAENIGLFEIPPRAFVRCHPQSRAWASDVRPVTMTAALYAVSRRAFGGV